MAFQSNVMPATSKFDGSKQTAVFRWNTRQH